MKKPSNGIIRALEQIPGDLDILANKGLTLVEIGDKNQAIDLAEQYLEENTNNKGLLCVLKNAYEKSDNLSLAEFYEETLLELDPNYKCELIKLLSIEDEALI